MLNLIICLLHLHSSCSSSSSWVFSSGGMMNTGMNALVAGPYIYRESSHDRRRVNVPIIKDRHQWWTSIHNSPFVAHRWCEDLAIIASSHQYSSELSNNGRLYRWLVALWWYHLGKSNEHWSQQKRRKCHGRFIGESCRVWAMMVPQWCNHELPQEE